ncbi:uncharacterized protein KY384_000474 [Bacidia gigantensis]|uniref:uncharacterized protein n=1 Tax=Bacidia gigantensis TaxID=2732470 RepID=UPI001D03A324|nr:uncharacterized protein KY384_000474 [Bacidia gigantensis]KAG8525714.1 hypothetical protein KY384_000474 [Bacidia gigantensis]
MSNPRETLRIAHTARCKLQIAADRPDRNFRFILGHALTLDKVMLRVAEIETSSSSSDGDDSISDDEPAQPVPRRVSFSGDVKGRQGGARGGGGGARRSPPPPAELGDAEEDVEDDDEDEDSAPLQRFPSASATPAGRTAYRDGDELSEEELRGITAGHGNAELVDAYNHVAGCRCHGQKGLVAENVWEIPSAMEKGVGAGPRMAVVQVQA